MKSRVNWTIFGERNTSFFHMTTLARRSRNRISSIMNEEGVWVHDVEQVQEVFTNSFVKLYQTDQSACPRVQRWDSEWCMRLEMNEAYVVGLCERPRPWPIFYMMLGQTHVNGWSRVVASQNRGSTDYIFPLRLWVLQWSRHLFNYWKNKKTIIEKFLILLI